MTWVTQSAMSSQPNCPCCHLTCALWILWSVSFNVIGPMIMSMEYIVLRLIIWTIYWLCHSCETVEAAHFQYFIWNDGHVLANCQCHHQLFISRAFRPICSAVWEIDCFIGRLSQFGQPSLTHSLVTQIGCKHQTEELSPWGGLNMHYEWHFWQFELLLVMGRINQFIKYSLL